MWPFKRTTNSPATATLEEALEQLDKIGVGFAPGANVEDLLFSLGGTIESPVDKIQLLCVLGGESEADDSKLLSNDIWHVDAECIEDHGDYARLAERFVILTHGDIQLKEIEDYVDIEAGKAFLEFTHREKRVHWDLKIDDDWMDPQLYSNFRALLSSVGSKRKFRISALGQDSLILCGDERLTKGISEFSGLAFYLE